MYAPARRTPYVEWQLPRRDARLIEAQFSQAPPLGNVSSIPVLRLRRAQATRFSWRDIVLRTRDLRSSADITCRGRASLGAHAPSCSQDGDHAMVSPKIHLDVRERTYGVRNWVKSKTNKP